MKFDVSKVVNGCRLGRLSEFGHCVDKTIETPSCMIYTRGGSVPNLSRELLDRLENMSGLLQMPLTTLADHQDAISQYKKGVASFAGVQGHAVLSCVQDPVQAVPSGYNDKLSTSIWTKGGRLKLDLDSFMAVQEALQPDIYEVLTDDDTPKTASKKRLQKAFDRSLAFLDECITRHEKSEHLQKSALLGVVGGGYDEEVRCKLAKETAKRNVQGFVIGGLHRFGPETELFDYKEEKALIQKTLSCLPENKPRFLHGIMRPHNVLHAIEAGIDVIDTSYPYMAMERGCALSFRYRLSALSAGGAEGSSMEEENDVTEDMEINLKDKRFFDDLRPLVPGCECYTCSTHSRAYINHLCNTQELLAGILLIMHNLHHFCGFMAEIRTALSTGRYSELHKLIMSQDAGKPLLDDKSQGDGNSASQGVGKSVSQGVGKRSLSEEQDGKQKVPQHS